MSIMRFYTYLIIKRKILLLFANNFISKYVSIPGSVCFSSQTTARIPCYVEGEANKFYFLPRRVE